MICLFSSVVLLSATDLLTTWIALGKGLVEGNVMLLSLASLVGLRFMEVIALTKLSFISGAALVSLVGIRSGVPKMKKVTFGFMAAFAIVLLLVTLNNWILITF